jgi:hypothetical protein
MPNPYPTFLIIGAAKAGTTALHNQLNEHPAIFMSRVKEPRFFNHNGYSPIVPGEGRPDRPTTPDEYRALFEDVGDATAVGESTADYLEIPEAAARIHAWNPGMRIIAVLRHPVERAYSHYVMMQNWGRMPIRPFETVFRSQILGNPNWLAEPYDAYGCADSLYYESLKRYYELFPREQILILKHHDLLHKGEETFERIFTFLGVDPAFRIDTTRRYYVGKVPHASIVWRMLLEPNLAKSVAQTVVPTPLRHAISKRLRRMTTKTKRELSPAVRREFLPVYYDDLVKTQELTGLDLSEWLVDLK